MTLARQIQAALKREPLSDWDHYHALCLVASAAEQLSPADDPMPGRPRTPRLDSPTQEERAAWYKADAAAQEGHRHAMAAWRERHPLDDGAIRSAIAALQAILCMRIPRWAIDHASTHPGFQELLGSAKEAQNPRARLSLIKKEQNHE